MNKPPYVCPRGKQGIFHVQVFVNGKRTWRSTHTTDRAEAEKIAARLRLEHSARDVFTADLIEAVLPSEISRNVFRKYPIADLQKFLGLAVEMKLKQAARRNSGLRLRLTDEEKQWAEK